jgi:hypothetical protein
LEIILSGRYWMLVVYVIPFFVVRKFSRQFLVRKSLIDVKILDLDWHVLTVEVQLLDPWGPCSVNTRYRLGGAPKS